MPTPLHADRRRRIVVTGGAGFIGSHLVEALAMRGHDIVVVDNLSRGNRANLERCTGQISFVAGDIRDFVSIRDVFQGADLIFHLAAQANVLGAEADPDYSLATNVGGTLQVLRAAHAIGARVIFTSSREVYGEATALPVPETAPLTPKNLYGASKASGEQYCRVYAERGLDVRVLRLANVYGPRDHGRVVSRFIESALRGHPLTLYGGDQVIDFIWVGHVVDALLNAADRPVLAESLNIGSGRGISLQELPQRIYDLLGINLPIVYAPRRPSEVVRFIANPSRARSLLNLAVDEDPLFGLPMVAGWVRDSVRGSIGVHSR